VRALFTSDRWLKAETWIAAVLFAALCGNASAAVVEIAGIGDDLTRLAVRVIGSMAGAVLAVTTIPPSAHDATKSRVGMLMGAFAAGVVSGGVIGELLNRHFGLGQSHEAALLGYGLGSYVVWLALRFFGRSSAKVDDMDSAISLWGRLMSARQRSQAPAPKRRSTRRG
jgi:predicted lipid-binding transport protein (Tim44 family)